MAMNDDMDELLRLYRHASNEAPAARLDARILGAADRAASMRRWSRRIAWPAAIAASLLLWTMWPAPGHRSPLTTDPMAAHDAGRVRSELQQMDVTPPRNDVVRFLLSTNLHPQPETGNAL